MFRTLQKHFALLVFLFFSSNLSADCLCGTTKKDPLYRKAVETLEVVLNHVFIENAYPLLFPNFELYNSKNQRIFEDEGVIKWTKRVEEIKCFPELAFLQWDIGNVRVIRRNVEWSSQFDIREKAWENKDETSFVFCKDYSAIPRAFHFLRKDFELYYDRSISFCQRRLQDLKKGKRFFSNEEDTSYFEDISYSSKDFLYQIERLTDQRKSFFSRFEQKEKEALQFCKESLDLCAKYHQNPLANYDLGLLSFLEGKSFEGFTHICSALENCSPEILEKINAQAHILKGQIELELGLYADAVLSLTKALQKDPDNQEIYLDRAIAFFENGQPSEAFADFLHQKTSLDFSPTQNQDLQKFAQAFGLSITNGFSKALNEIAPALIYTANGIGHCLWAGISEPMAIPEKIVQPLYKLLEYVHQHSLKEMGKDVAHFLSPELTKLVTEWNHLSLEKRGELAGLAIGEFGFNYCQGIYSSKAPMQSLFCAKRKKWMHSILWKPSLKVLLPAKKFFKNRNNLLLSTLKPFRNLNKMKNILKLYKINIFLNIKFVKPYIKQGTKHFLDRRGSLKIFL